MVFNSYIFLFAFLPLSLAGYFCLNKFHKYSWAKAFLTAMSLWFYAYYEISYLWILLLSIGMNYILHRVLLQGTHKKLFLTAGIIINVALLGYFKYFNFLITTINDVLEQNFSAPQILLPLGISFFTFQQIAFLVDTAKGKAEKQKLLDYALFVAFFPQLSSGPIVNYEEMMPQYQSLDNKAFSPRNVYIGLRLLVIGLAKKVLLADTLAKAVNWGFTYHYVLDGMNTFLVILLFTFQLYLDFSGYTDMARGVGYMFNLKLPVNFMSPYKSQNIVEFWDRWHMTLTRFFTRYIYIPLGGNRKGRIRTYINVLVVFLISGIWHGAGFTFILWGLFHGLATVVTRIWMEIKKKLPERKPSFAGKLAAGAATFLFVAFAWTFFRAESISQAVEMLKTVFTGAWSGVYREIADMLKMEEIWAVMRLCGISRLPYADYYCFIGILAIVLFILFGCKNAYETEAVQKPKLWQAVLGAGIVLWCVLSFSEVSSFLYVNF